MFLRLLLVASLATTAFSSNDCVPGGNQDSEKKYSNLTPKKAYEHLFKNPELVEDEVACRNFLKQSFHDNPQSDRFIPFSNHLFKALLHETLSINFPKKWPNLFKHPIIVLRSFITRNGDMDSKTPYLQNERHISTAIASFLATHFNEVNSSTSGFHSTLADIKSHCNTLKELSLLNPSQAITTFLVNIRIPNKALLKMIDSHYIEVDGFIKQNTTSFEGYAQLLKKQILLSSIIEMRKSFTAAVIAFDAFKDKTIEPISKAIAAKLSMDIQSDETYCALNKVESVKQLLCKAYRSDYRCLLALYRNVNKANDPIFKQLNGERIADIAFRIAQMLLLTKDKAGINSAPVFSLNKDKEDIDTAISLVKIAHHALKIGSPRKEFMSSMVKNFEEYRKALFE
ncbi:MAG: hypothetical protein ACPGXY_04305 [Alphaproteobacteria bacterium]